MTEFNENIGLVQTQNKARSYNKRVGELQQQVTDLQELCADAVAKLPEEDKWYFEARLEKLKEKVLDIYPIRSYVRSATHDNFAGIVLD